MLHMFGNSIASFAAASEYFSRSPRDIIAQREAMRVHRAENDSGSGSDRSKECISPTNSEYPLTSLNGTWELFFGRGKDPLADDRLRFSLGCGCGGTDTSGGASIH
jgi:hypothetical protein